MSAMLATHVASQRSLLDEVGDSVGRFQIGALSGDALKTSPVGTGLVALQLLAPTRSKPNQNRSGFSRASGNIASQCFIFPTGPPGLLD